MPEKSKLIEFEGFIVDLFISETGDLGITVEKKENEDDSVDIFVDKDNLTVVSSNG